MKLTTTTIAMALFLTAALAIAGTMKSHDGGVATLRPNSSFATSPPAAKVIYQGSDPGENQLYDRGYQGAPPQIPHSVADFSVTEEQNDCVDCHTADSGVEGATAIPASHLVKGGDLDGRRFLCNLCHTPQTGDKALVKNENDRHIVKAKKK